MHPSESARTRSEDFRFDLDQAVVPELRRPPEAGGEVGAHTRRPADVDDREISAARSVIALDQGDVVRSQQGVGEHAPAQTRTDDDGARPHQRQVAPWRRATRVSNRHPVAKATRGDQPSRRLARSLEKPRSRLALNPP